MLSLTIILVAAVAVPAALWVEVQNRKPRLSAEDRAERDAWVALHAKLAAANYPELSVPALRPRLLAAARLLDSMREFAHKNESLADAYKRQ